MKIAVVGSGISGLSAAWLLQHRHSVTLYDRADYLGGHTNTVDVPDGERDVAIDTGFIVFNDRNYPNLCALFDHMEVETAPSDMSFSVSADGGRFEYGGARASMLFAQKRNAANPRFIRMLGDMVRFYRIGRQALESGVEDISLRQFLKLHRFGSEFVDYHILPMSAAIWSAPAGRVLDFHARPFLQFMANHGLLGLSDRPAWRTVVGGGRSYVRALMTRFPGDVRLNTAVERVTRSPVGVLVEDRQGGSERFDAVVMASHADESLRMLKDADPRERAVLGAFNYQRNVAVLHADRSFMPRRRAAWASWNYLLEENAEHHPPAVTYWMNRLQPLPTRRDFFVTLNPPVRSAPTTILRSFPYDHPMFDSATDRMQREIWDIQGRGGVWFCGSYLGHGFHEDGIQSGLAVAEALGGVRRPWRVADESGRLQIPDGWAPVLQGQGRAA
jgi:predicted NAD/FAD-binding protein